MNLSTLPFDRAATNISVQMPPPTSLSGPTTVTPFTAAPTPLETTIAVTTGLTREPRLSAIDFRWKESLTRDIFYWYQLAGADVELSNVRSWIVQTVSTPWTETYFRNTVLQAKLPAKWISEGVQPPTVKCRLLAYKAWEHLYTKFGLLPVRVSASVDSGVTLTYNHLTNGRTLFLEVYNDLEVAVVINDSKRIAYSENVENLDFDCTFLNFNV